MGNDLPQSLPGKAHSFVPSMWAQDSQVGVNFPLVQWWRICFSLGDSYMLFRHTPWLAENIEAQSSCPVWEVRLRNGKQQLADSRAHHSGLMIWTDRRDRSVSITSDWQMIHCQWDRMFLAGLSIGLKSLWTVIVLGQCWWKHYLDFLFLNLGPALRLMSPTNIDAFRVWGRSQHF